jgi:hypothetical protein
VLSVPFACANSWSETLSSKLYLLPSSIMKSGEQKPESNAVRIDTLSTEHIRSLQRQLGQQVEGKKKAVEVLLSTAAAFDQSKSAVQDLAKLNEGVAGCCAAIAHLQIAHAPVQLVSTNYHQLARV